MNFLDIRYYNLKLIKQMKVFGIPPIRIDESQDMYHEDRYIRIKDLSKSINNTYEYD